MVLFEASPPPSPRQNLGVKQRWARFRAAQRFRLTSINVDGGVDELLVKDYEALAKHLNLAISTIRQLFAAGGGRFQRTIDGRLVEITRGRVTDGR